MPPSISLSQFRPPSASINSGQRDAMARDLAALIGGEVRFGRHERMLYATDASLYQVEPIGVVCPRSIEEAARVVQFCCDRDLPMLPRGGGTSLAGQAVNDAVVIDMSAHCRALLQVDAAGRTARVEPGIVLDALNEQLAPHGLMFGPDVATSSHANIGGMIGNNSAGAHSILYGRTVEHLIGLDVMLADGRRMLLEQGAASRDPRIAELTRRVVDVIRPIERAIDARFPKIIRHVNGYNLDLILRQMRECAAGDLDQINLAHLLCGSEGTLAVTLGATINLVPVPRCKGLAIVGFVDVDEALRALSTILTTSPAAVELIDDVVIALANENREYRRYVELLPKPPAGAGAAAGAVLYVAYFADSAGEIESRFQQLQSLFPRQTINRYTEPRSMNQAWKLRKAGEPLLHGLHGPRKPVTFIEDTAVDPQRLAAFVADFRAMVARHGTRAAYYAHASVGCLHIRPLVAIRDDADVAMMQRIAEEATDLVMHYGGALSGEHGDGRVRTHLLERFYGPEIFQAFRHIKAIFDPRNLLNPGNIVEIDPQRMVSNLRVKPGDRPVSIPPAPTFFRYEREHGFGEAVELCNGAGVCRRMSGGTMCPSYRATRDERHATRGRGNALRLAISGQFSPDGVTPAWNDPGTLETLDLCLSCKACKSECPSNVDIAKLKAEYLAQSYQQRGGPPLNARIFGNIRSINRLGSAVHPLANLLNHAWPVRAAANRLLDLHPNRPLPRFGRSLYRWMRRRRNIPRLPASAPAVILFPDCFTTYNEPAIGRAAILTLERLGYRVLLPRLSGNGGGCCGRAMISTGMLQQAAAVCRNTAAQLLAAADDANVIAIVGCEPSCISALKDEWLELDMGAGAPSPQSLRDLAARAFLVEEFIDLAWDRHPHPPAAIPLQPLHCDLILHGHCHQKALWGVETSSRALRRVAGERLQVLDSGCCGMAGQFGYARDHYQVSMQIGELSLFGPLRASPQAIIAAPGTSCRQQIHDGLARHALHPIELIARCCGVIDP